MEKIHLSIAALDIFSLVGIMKHNHSSESHKTLYGWLSIMSNYNTLIILSISTLDVLVLGGWVETGTQEKCHDKNVIQLPTKHLYYVNIHKA